MFFKVYFGDTLTDISLISPHQNLCIYLNCQQVEATPPKKNNNMRTGNKI